MKTGLVLEGGAMRGMFTVGVLDAFMQHHIAVDGVVAVSAGALFGVNLLSGQKGRAIRYNKKYNHDPDYMGIRPLLREGNIVNTEYAYERVPHQLDPFDDKSYIHSGIPYYAVVTDINTGQPAYLQVHSVFRQMDVLRASASMPFVSRPVEIDGRHYLDGGISDSIPFGWLRDQGYDRLIVILTRPEDYRKKPMSKALVKLFYRKNPALCAQLYRRHDNYNRAVEELVSLEKSGQAFVIRPPRPLEIGRIESKPEKLQEVYDVGFRQGTDCIPGLKLFLERGIGYESEFPQRSENGLVIER